MRNLALIAAFFFFAIAAFGEKLTFQGAETWNTWRAPVGLTQVGEAGQLQLTKFSRNINAVADAHRFSYESKKRGTVSGGIWEANSNPTDAGNIIDGDPQTFWRPDTADEVEDWAIEIDLGRAVLASEIRLSFPDEEGARPFRQFTVYASTGTRISVQDDLVLLNRSSAPPNPTRPTKSQSRCASSPKPVFSKSIRGSISTRRAKTTTAWCNASASKSRNNKQTRHWPKSKCAASATISASAPSSAAASSTASTRSIQRISSTPT